MKLIVKRYYDLRTSQIDKVEEAELGCFTVYVNKLHTIAHGIVVEEPDLTVRLRIPGWLRGTHDRYVDKYFKKRLHYMFPHKIEVKQPPLPESVQFKTERLFKNWAKKNRNR